MENVLNNMWTYLASYFYIFTMAREYCATEIWPFLANPTFETLVEHPATAMFIFGLVIWSALSACLYRMLPASVLPRATSAILAALISIAIINGVANNMEFFTKGFQFPILKSGRLTVFLPEGWMFTVTLSQLFAYTAIGATLVGLGMWITGTISYAAPLYYRTTGILLIVGGQIVLALHVVADVLPEYMIFVFLALIIAFWSRARTSFTTHVPEHYQLIALSFAVLIGVIAIGRLGITSVLLLVIFGILCHHPRVHPWAEEKVRRLPFINRIVPPSANEEVDEGAGI